MRLAFLTLAAGVLVSNAFAQSPPQPAPVTEPAEPERPREPLVNAALPDGDWELSVGASLELTPYDRTGLPNLNVIYAVTERLSWRSLLSAAYRWGESGVAELSARGGLNDFGVGNDDEGWVGTTDAGVTGQLWLAPALSLLTEAAAVWDFQTQRRSDWPSRSDQLTLQGSVGCSWRPVAYLTLSLAAGLEGDLYVHDARFHYYNRRELAFGTLQRPGYRNLPLLRVHITPRVAFDLHARWAFSFRGSGGNRERYVLGFTFLL